MVKYQKFSFQIMKFTLKQERKFIKTHAVVCSHGSIYKKWQVSRAIHGPSRNYSWMYFIVHNSILTMFYSSAVKKIVFMPTKKNGILFQKFFWPTVRKKCSSDWEKLFKFGTEGREFAKHLNNLFKQWKARTISGSRILFLVVSQI